MLEMFAELMDRLELEDPGQQPASPAHLAMRPRPGTSSSEARRTGGAEHFDGER